eukprot:TRINITY_DN23154_c0_g1_i1.p1 TRINITY_DN23154_c0_g1~~TRINITY_DN23154_c0_g1_i1.p1  ORF type:complete len:599 (-),score=81.48 TRINITY_DN23154_c0_g1_i1:164-1960(-)
MLRLFPVRSPTLPPATHTNCVILGNKRITIVDPGTPYEDELLRLCTYIDEVVTKSNGKVVQVLATHHHFDHISGVAYLARRYAATVAAHSATFSLALASHLAAGPTLPTPDAAAGVVRDTTGHKNKHARRGTFIKGTEVIVMNDGDPVDVDDADWRVLHTPGHAAGHLCLEDASTGRVVAGDMVASTGTIVLEPPGVQTSRPSYSHSKSVRADAPATGNPGHSPTSEGPLVATTTPESVRESASRCSASTTTSSGGSTGSSTSSVGSARTLGHPTALRPFMPVGWDPSVPLLAGGDLDLYVGSLHRLLAGKPALLVPAHGAPRVDFDHPLAETAVARTFVVLPPADQAPPKMHEMPQRSSSAEGAGVAASEGPSALLTRYIAHRLARSVAVLRAVKKIAMRSDVKDAGVVGAPADAVADVGADDDRGRDMTAAAWDRGRSRSNGHTGRAVMQQHSSPTFMGCSTDAENPMALIAGEGGEWCVGPFGIVDVVYRDTIPRHVRPLAVQQVICHLAALQRRGAVRAVRRAKASATSALSLAQSEHLAGGSVGERPEITGTSSSSEWALVVWVPEPRLQEVVDELEAEIARLQRSGQEGAKM